MQVMEQFKDLHILQNELAYKVPSFFLQSIELATSACDEVIFYSR